MVEYNTEVKRLDTVIGKHWLHTGSLPTRFAINVLDLDITKRCNLRCVYCFKSDCVSPREDDMSLNVALTAIDWILLASMNARDINVNLIGGEPLIAWKTIEKIVPYGKIKAAQHGKSIQFGTTTNLTLIDENIVSFAEKYGMGWHCSIDGVPEVQNDQRPRVGGKGSADLAERGAKLVLESRPMACARSTLKSTSISKMYECYLYFIEIGFQNVAFAMAEEKDWQAEHFEILEKELGKITSYAIESYRANKKVPLPYTYLVKFIVSGETREYACGAGRGIVLVDPSGDLWPCHRFDGADLDSRSNGQWCFGNIYEPGFNHDLHTVFLQRTRQACWTRNCGDCEIRDLCAGGCPACNLTTTKSIYKKHPNLCRISKIYYRNAKRFHQTLTEEGNELFQEEFSE